MIEINVRMEILQNIELSLSSIKNIIPIISLDLSVYMILSEQ